jgi:hypothetical protein
MTSAIIVASRYAIPSLDQTDEIFGTSMGGSAKVTYRRAK